MSELPKDAADHVYDLGALSHDQIPGAMDREGRLLVLRLDLDNCRSKRTFWHLQIELPHIMLPASEIEPENSPNSC